MLQRLSTLLVFAAAFAGFRPVLVSAQESRLYVPTADTWETVSADSAEADARALEDVMAFAMKRKSSSVIILYGGRILAERHSEVQKPGLRYRGMIHGKTQAGHVIEDVASVQKSITSVLVGIAQQKKLLKLSDPVARHLGQGWSEAAVDQESAITLKHLITMTSGLDDSLRYAAPAGQRWKYNSTAYGKTLDVVSAAAHMTPNELTRAWLTGPLKMTDSKWITRRSLLRRSQATNPHGFTTSARDLARFGLMMLAGGRWGSQTILSDKQYLKDSTSPSQNRNPAYGYLWWLNGQRFALRGTRRVSGGLIPEAPSDLYAALGALGRKVYVVPGRQLVVVRTGDNPESIGAEKFDRELWRLLTAAFPGDR